METWLLSLKNTGRINNLYISIYEKHDYQIVFCRTQAQNKKDCMFKLQEMIAEAYIEPKEREMWIGSHLQEVIISFYSNQSFVW